MYLTEGSQRKMKMVGRKQGSIRGLGTGTMSQYAIEKICDKLQNVWFHGCFFL